ncbi:tRNA (adenine(58)-N(1))-methyltransferase, mitochondrial [Chelmon rostratus]|uniref:tRNA (adenine(58)-N(1))-methyltransferase, mitochondrial n=1 Tax=Chelmon rostratus TaxID=109905 RepID=UPI001BE6D646|nr:tRNA (adenine(58)-N(1))-methyltransferase, mitochondrial [Chelmon rostratus]
MALQMPSVGLLLMHRLLRINISSQRCVSNRCKLVKLRKGRSQIRSFSTGSAKCNEDERDSSDSLPLSTTLTSKGALLSRRRRPLSPLERISGLLPRDALSPEVMQLREQNQQDSSEDTSIQVSTTQCTQEESGQGPALLEDDSEDSHAPDADVEPAASENPACHEEKRLMWPTLPGESLLAFGELLVAESHKGGRAEFRKMFQLRTGARLQSNLGIILHDDIAGQPAGRMLKTSQGTPFLIHRASLEDYALFMKRGPAISYPKDAAAMLLMMDVTEGDCVLESGSGSGAMSLFLSRAVGSKGSVLSVEIREDHHRRAVQNYRCWRTSWSVRQGEEWPDNVQFHKADLCTASPLLAGQAFHAVALDLLSPHLALPTVVPHLHPGAVCAVYLANITQVIDMLEGVRCLQLPLLCERIVEIPVRDWLVTPALRKDGSYCVRKAPILDDTSSGPDKEELAAGTVPAFSSIPYVARPHPLQMSHTAFLVKLRKFVQ